MNAFVFAVIATLLATLPAQALPPRLVDTWIQLGSQPGEVHHPAGIAVDANQQIYVTDSEKHCVQKFSSDGALLGEWGQRGSRSGEFDRPAGIAVSSDGTVYVVDPGNARIQRFSTQGAFLGAWGHPGSKPGEFTHLAYVAVDTSGDVFVAEHAGQRVQRFDATGSLVSAWNTFDPTRKTASGTIAALACDRTGYVYAATREPCEILKFSPDGLRIDSWALRITDADAPLCAGAIAVDQHGLVYAMEARGERTLVFSPEGQFLLWWGEPPATDAPPQNGAIAVRFPFVFQVDARHRRIDKLRFDEFPSETGDQPPRLMR
jgi:sugar lactone lactonase YvrE